MLSVPMPVGEILDRISILTIRRKRKGLSQNQLEYLGDLKEAVRHLRNWEELSEQVTLLNHYNELLWELEDQIRSVIDRDTIAKTALEIIKTNDSRCEAKAQINRLTNSTGELKQYTRGAQNA